VGEMLAGIALGPSLLGATAGHALFPADARPILAAVGNVGLALFMFLVGLELDLDHVRRRRWAVARISTAALVLPFALGLLLASALYPAHKTVAGQEIAFTPFALFVALSMSVTAFPVLARIIGERGLQRSPLGAQALACAAVQDVAAWCMLAGVLALLAGGGPATTALMFAGTLAFAGAVAVAVRVAINFARPVTLTRNTLAASLCGALACAWVTQRIGTHFVIGAFVLGAVIPRRETAELRQALQARMGPIVVSGLLPVYFLIPGLSVDLHALSAHDVLELLAIVAVACAGKLIGAGAAARAGGSSWHEAASLGALMNTRGLMELVVLTIGLSMGILDRPLFSALVAMAILTTLMTAPALRLADALGRRRAHPYQAAALRTRLDRSPTP
jgi:K+:H+ antiporter